MVVVVSKYGIGISMLLEELVCVAVVVLDVVSIELVHLLSR